MTKKIENIFNIILSDKSLFFAKKTDAFDLNIQSFKVCYPKSKHDLFHNQKIRTLLSKNFKRDVLEAYDHLVPYAYKADLARYCILFIQGGVYSDISHLHINPIRFDENVEMVFFRDIALIHPALSVSNAVIYSEPEQEDLYNLIYRVVENCNNRFYGHHPLEPTGPYLLGKHLANLDSHNNIIYGDSMAMVVGADPASAKRHIIKFMPNGDLIAFRNKKNNSSVDEFIEGGNNYAALWQERRAYGE